MRDGARSERECDLIHKNVDDKLEVMDDKLETIMAGVQDLQGLKDVLNPALATVKQQIGDHLEKHKTKWSSWQIALTGILALGTIGMFVVGLLALLK